MKKIFLSIISFTTSTLIYAQDSIAKIPTQPQLSFDNDNTQSLNSNSSIEILMPLFILAPFVILIVTVTKYILDYKLKNKIIDRGISEQLANSILEKSVTDKKDDSIKWAFLLLGLSGGLTLAYHTMPLHIHSLAIMVFSLGLSYLAYSFYLRKKNK